MGPQLLVVAALALAPILRAQEQAEKIVEPSPAAPREKLLEWKTPQGQPYWYRLPEKLKAEAPPALILMLHGTGMTHGWSFWNYPIIAGGFRKNDIVVSPEGLSPDGNGHFNFMQGEADGDQLADLIALFRKKFAIGRVYVYGHSQGAFFAYWFAGAHPELIDGIVAHAGNVLDVAFPKLAKEKVGIAILHGKADAVVPVECAYRTEKIYLEQGYKKVKLLAVDGLTEQSGHWPLPQQAAELLAWLDQVSAQSAEQAVGNAMLALDAEAIDLAVVRECVELAEKLLPKAPAAAKTALPPRIAELRAFLDDAAGLYVAALQHDAALADPKLPFGKWVATFREGERAFGPLKAWQTAMKAPRALAQKHDAKVDAALKAVNPPSTKAFDAAVEALKDGYLAARGDELALALGRMCAEPPKGVKEEGVAAARALLSARAGAGSTDTDLANAVRERAAKVAR